MIATSTNPAHAAIKSEKPRGAKRRAGGLVNGWAHLRCYPPPHAEILAKRIRQNFFLSADRLQVGGVGRGFKSLRPSAQLPHGVARADFFSAAPTFRNQSGIKEFKRPSRNNALCDRLGFECLDFAYLFSSRLNAPLTRKIVAKFGVGGSAGCLII